MDLKQALQQRGGGSANTKFNVVVSDISSSGKSSATSAQSDGGNNSSCSNNHSASANTGESFRGGSPLANSLVGGANAILFNSNGSSYNISSNPSASHLTGRSRPLSELDGHDSLLLKFPRLADAASPHSSTYERQALFHVDGASRSSASHHSLSSYLSSSNHSSNHGSPTSTYAGTSNTYSFFDGVSSHSRVHPYAILKRNPPGITRLRYFQLFRPHRPPSCRPPAGPSIRICLV